MMDPSTKPNMHGPQLQRDNSNPSYNGFLGGVSYGDSGEIQPGNDDFPTQYFDPALFENSGNNYAHTFPHQPSSFQPPYEGSVPRQSPSPAVPQYGSPHAQFSTSQYPTQMLDSRAVPQGQQNFDPRFYQQRPSPSPVSLEGYQYQPHLNYQNQPYNPQPLTMQQRQSTTPIQNYPPRQPQLSPYMNFGNQGPQMSSARNPDMMQFQNYQEHSHQPSHSFVDPSLLNSNQVSDMNGNHQIFQGRSPYSQPPYANKPGYTLDPRSLQGVQGPQPPLSTVNQFILAQPAPTQPNPAPKSKTVKDPNAPKAPRTKSKSGGVVAQKDGHDSASSSGSDSEDLYIEDDTPPEIRPAVITVSMPTDERGKALWNVVQAVWSPRNKPASADKVRSGLVLFGETVRTLRDSWKVKAEKLKQAEIPGAKTASEIPTLKADVAHYRQVMEVVVNRSLQYAHPSVLKRLGDNPVTMSALYSFLLDRFNAADYDSPLVQNILKFAVNFETVDEQILEQTKWSKILPRLAKKATNDSKTFVQSILTNATAATAKKKKAAQGKVAANGPDGVQKDPATGMKRVREGDAAVPPGAKKTLVRPSSKPLALQNAERRRAQEALAANKSDKGSSTTNGTQPTVATKAKVAVVAPPKSAMFSSLMSASKKPGTSLAARAAASKDTPSTASASSAPTPAVSQVSAEFIKKDSPPRSLGPGAPSKAPSSSFLGFLADMDKKEEVKPKKEEEVLQETAEQREKRLRKESRRKLRVSWKPDSDLVETRFFVHDPEEESGQTDSMMRDAGDTAKEGEMLKRHKGMDDLEDDEDEDSTQEEFIDYTIPSEVDLSDIRADLIDNTVRFGGPIIPVSSSKTTQEKLEANTVMVVYASETDRPPTPKEAPDDGDDGDFQPCINFGDPGGLTRSREQLILAHRRTTSKPFMLDGSDAMEDVSSGTNAQESGSIGVDIQRTLSMLGSQVQQGQPVAQAAPAGGGVDLQRLIATVQQFKQLQYQTPAQGTAAPPVNNNLSALLAQIQQPQGIPLGLGGNPNSYPGADESRKHARSDSGAEVKSDYGRDSGSKKKKGAPKVDGALPYNYKTLTCSFWKQNKCTKGDNCTYRHDDD